MLISVLLFVRADSELLFKAVVQVKPLKENQKCYKIRKKEAHGIRE
jgi:hypothetical protein